MYSKPQNMHYNVNHYICAIMCAICKWMFMVLNYKARFKLNVLVINLDKNCVTQYRQVKSTSFEFNFVFNTSWRCCLKRCYISGTQMHTETLTSAPWRALLYPSSTLSMSELRLSRNTQWEFRRCRSQVRSLLPVTAVDVPPSSRKGRSVDRKCRWYCNSLSRQQNQTVTNISDSKAYQCLWWHPVLSSCTGSHGNLQETHRFLCTTA